MCVCSERGRCEDEIKDPEVQFSGGEDTTQLYFEVVTKCFRKKRGF